MIGIGNKLLDCNVIFDYNRELQSIDYGIMPWLNKWKQETLNKMKFIKYP